MISFNRIFVMNSGSIDKKMGLKYFDFLDFHKYKLVGHNLLYIQIAIYNFFIYATYLIRSIG